MKENEIRLNNLFVQAGSNFVETVTFETFELLSRGAIKISGIPLTEKWLLNSGFKQITTNEYLFVIPLKDRSLAVSIYGNVEISSWDRLMISHGCICEHVHQLQNLYFALTGEELQINQ